MPGSRLPVVVPEVPTAPGVDGVVDDGGAVGDAGAVAGAGAAAADSSGPCEPRSAFRFASTLA